MALEVATVAHLGQKRDGGDLWINHLVQVYIVSVRYLVCRVIARVGVGLG